MGKGSRITYSFFKMFGVVDVGFFNFILGFLKTACDVGAFAVVNN